MNLQSPPAYSILETLDLKNKITNWSSLYEYCRKFQAPSDEYEIYTVALVSSKETQLKRRLSSVLAQLGTAHAIMRNGETTVIILRTKDEKSALDALGSVALKCRVHMQIVDEDERKKHAISGAWPTAIPYAATILPTPAKWYDKGRPTSSGCLNEDSPNVMRLGFAAASPKLRRAASLATGAVSAVVCSATLEKVGGTIGVFIGGAPGAAAGTLAGKSLDGLHTTSGNTNGDENVPQEGQITETRMMLRLIETGRITATAAELRDLLQTPTSRRAELVSAALEKGMPVDEIENLVKLAFPEQK